MLAIFLCYGLMIDLAVANNMVSAYVLVCGCMIHKVLLCLVAIVNVILMFVAQPRNPTSYDSDYQSPSDCFPMEVHYVQSS